MSSGRRLYLGHLSQDATRDDVEKLFLSINDKAKVVDVRINNGYGFIEYDAVEDAEDAVRDLNGREFLGERLQVEFAKAPRSFDAPRPRMQPRNTGYRLTITGFGPGTSWQDLKDFARQAGSVTYADVSRDRADEGVIEFMSSRDVDDAFRKLDGTDLNGGRIKLYEERGSSRRRSPSPPPRRRRSPSPRRSSRRDDDDDRRDSRRDDRDTRDRRRSRSPDPRDRGRD